MGTLALCELVISYINQIVSQCKLKLIDHQEDDEYNQQSSTSKEKPVSMQAILIASNSGRNISRVFDHENSSRPPSLCFARKSLPSKSNLSQSISESAACDYEDMESTPSDATVVIFDAAFVIQMLVPRIKGKGCKHFKIMLN